MVVFFLLAFMINALIQSFDDEALGRLSWNPSARGHLELMLLWNTYKPLCEIPCSANNFKAFWKFYKQFLPSGLCSVSFDPGVPFLPLVKGEKQSVEKAFIWISKQLGMGLKWFQLILWINLAHGWIVSLKINPMDLFYFSAQGRSSIWSVSPMFGEIALMFR